MRVIQIAYIFRVTIECCGTSLQSSRFLPHARGARERLGRETEQKNLFFLLLLVPQTTATQSTVKPKPKLSLLPITTDANITMSQSELEASAWKWNQARENACEQVTIGFGFTADWLIKWRESFSQSQSVVMQNQSKRELHSTKLNWKQLYFDRVIFCSVLQMSSKCLKRPGAKVKATVLCISAELTTEGSLGSTLLTFFLWSKQ